MVLGGMGGKARAQRNATGGLPAYRSGIPKQKDQAVAAERASIISSRAVPCRLASSLSWLR
jgi:hypothetical protein